VRGGGKEGRGRDWCPHMTFLHDAPAGEWQEPIAHP